MQSILKPEYCMPVMINNTVPTSVTKSRAERLDTLSYRTVHVALLKLVGVGWGTLTTLSRSDGYYVWFSFHTHKRAQKEQGGFRKK